MGQPKIFRPSRAHTNNFLYFPLPRADDSIVDDDDGEDCAAVDGGGGGDGEEKKEKQAEWGQTGNLNTYILWISLASTHPVRTYGMYHVARAASIEW